MNDKDTVVTGVGEDELPPVVSPEKPKVDLDDFKEEPSGDFTPIKTEPTTVPVEEKPPLPDLDTVVFPDWEKRPHFSDPDPEQISAVVLPSDLASTIDTAFKESLNFQLKENPSNRHWAESVSSGMKLNTIGERFLSTINTGVWTKNLTTDTNDVGPAVEKLTHVTNTRLSGQEAVIRANLYMGGGEYFAVPLWNTGLWYTLDPCTDLELLELYREITASKINIGYYTYGAIFSSVSGFAVETVARFIVKHIGTTSLKYDESEDLLEHISLSDLQYLIGSLNATIFPGGVNYSTACTANPKKCTVVTERKLDIKELFRVNGEAIPIKLRNFMARSRKVSNNVTLEVLQSYQSDLLVTLDKTVKLDLPNNKQVTITLKVPSVAEYIRSAHAWIDSITTMIEQAVVKPKDDNERNKFVMEASLASSLRQYSHFVSAIEFGEGLEVVDHAAIEEILVSYSGSAKIRTQLVEAVGKFIDASTVSVIGVPNFECPACGANMDEPNKRILPLDQLELFMRILGTKVIEIRER
jgi:hypothetical protein